MSQSCDEIQIIMENSQSFATSRSTVMDCSLEIDEKVANVNKQETIVINRPKVNGTCKKKVEIYENSAKRAESNLKTQQVYGENNFKRLWAANQLKKLGKFFVNINKLI